MNRWNCKPCEIFTLNFANSLYFISHTGISSPTHTPLSLASTWARWPGQLFMPASCNSCHRWTSLPHHSSECFRAMLLLLQPVLFCDWSFLFLNDQCDFSQPHTVCSVFSRQKLENNNQNYLKKEGEAPKQVTIGQSHIISLNWFLFLVGTLMSCKYHNKEKFKK